MKKYATMYCFQQELLRSELPRKVIFFCYMRGGSTFFSELLRQNPDVMYFFEPFDGFSEFYGVVKWNRPMNTFYAGNATDSHSQPVLR